MPSSGLSDLEIALIVIASVTGATGIVAPLIAYWWHRSGMAVLELGIDLLDIQRQGSIVTVIAALSVKNIGGSTATLRTAEVRTWIMTAGFRENAAAPLPRSWRDAVPERASKIPRDLTQYLLPGETVRVDDYYTVEDASISKKYETLLTVHLTVPYGPPAARTWRVRIVRAANLVLPGGLAIPARWTKATGVSSTTLRIFVLPQRTD